MKYINRIVVPYVVVHYHELASLLEFDYSTIQRIRRQHQYDSYRCCKAVFEHWLSSNEGISPKTWEYYCKH